MAHVKKKIVFVAETGQVYGIRDHVKNGRYRNASDFLREAVNEKLARLRRERLTKQVANYCNETGDASEFIAVQAFDPESQ